MPDPNSLEICLQAKWIRELIDEDHWHGTDWSEAERKGEKDRKVQVAAAVVVVVVVVVWWWWWWGAGVASSAEQHQGDGAASSLGSALFQHISALIV